MISARPATAHDLDVLVHLYGLLEDEMMALHPMWPLADGLAEPVGASLAEAIAAPDDVVMVGEIDGYPIGFILARLEPLLPRAGGDLVGSIRLVFTEVEAREVGVAEAMREAVLEHFRGIGVTKFDAHVLPGHRLAKNFFEAGGFSARSIIMHHDDHPTDRPGRDARRF